MKQITLNNGLVMPLLGFGVYQIPDLQECEDSVLHAIKTGYRLIDTATAYENEEAVGAAIRKSGIPREEIFITTKLWIHDGGYTNAKKAFNLSMEKLGLDYLDLYLLHMPYGDVYGSWRAMEELYYEGKVKAIGVCNFHPDRLADLIFHNDVVPAVNQVETHPFYQRGGEHEYMKAKGIQMESWGPLAEGKNDIFNNEILKTIGQKYNKSVPQVILRWLLQRQIVAIPKSVKKERIAENFDVFDFELSEDQMQAIALLDAGRPLILDLHDPESTDHINNERH